MPTQTAKPIHTVEDYDAAEAAGASIEFTSGGCSYDLPPHDQLDSGGWIPATSVWRDWLPEDSVNHKFFASGDFRLRAFYPEAAE